METIKFNYDMFKKIISPLIKQSVTDIHLVPMAPPFIRKAKRLNELKVPARDDEGNRIMASLDKMSPTEVYEFIEAIIRDNYSEDKVDEILNLIQHKEAEITISIPKVSRFRVHISRQRMTFSCSIKVVPSRIPNISDFPAEIKQFIQYNSGLVIISGKTSSGKTTTTAMLIDEINKSQAKKIITLEDPIEYLHRHNKSMVSQREIGVDTASYSSGLLSSLREDPDVIVVGEIRDIETFDIALAAAESGCLVITSMPCSDSREVLERIESMYPDNKHNQVRSQLASVLRGIVCQQLIPCIDEESASPLVAAFEILSVNASREISSAIRIGDFDRIPSLMERYKKGNIRTMKDSLQALKDEGKISQEDWFARNGLLESR